MLHFRKCIVSSIRYAVFISFKTCTDSRNITKIGYEPSFFENDGVSKIFSFYRLTNERSFTPNAGKTREKFITIGEGDKCSENDEEVEPNAKKFGLDFVQLPGHFPVIRTIYKMR